MLIIETGAGFPMVTTGQPGRDRRVTPLASGTIPARRPPRTVGRRQGTEAERLVSEGRIASDILPPQETVAVMATLDAIREQVGLRYPGE